MKKEHWERITVTLGRTLLDTIISSKNVLLGYHLKWPIHPKTYFSDLRLSLDYVFYSPRTNSQPPLIVVRPFISQILSPTLLQIYYTGLIGPISFFIWIWATICDPTLIYIEVIMDFLFVQNNIPFFFFIAEMKIYIVLLLIHVCRYTLIQFTYILKCDWIILFIQIHC